MSPSGCGQTTVATWQRRAARQAARLGRAESLGRSDCIRSAVARSALDRSAGESGAGAHRLSRGKARRRRSNSYSASGARRSIAPQQASSRKNASQGFTDWHLSAGGLASVLAPAQPHYAHHRQQERQRHHTPLLESRHRCWCGREVIVDDRDLCGSTTYRIRRVSCGCNTYVQCNTSITCYGVWSRSEGTRRRALRLPRRYGQWIGAVHGVSRGLRGKREVNQQTR